MNLPLIRKRKRVTRKWSDRWHHLEQARIFTMIVVYPERTHLSTTTASACGRAEGHRLGAMMNTLSRLPVWILGQTDWVATTASDLLRFTFLCVRVCASRIFMEERVCCFSVSQPWSEAESTKSRAFTVLVRECCGCTVDATGIEIFLNKFNGSFNILRFECRLICRLCGRLLPRVAAGMCNHCDHPPGSHFVLLLFPSWLDRFV